MTSAVDFGKQKIIICSKHIYILKAKGPVFTRTTIMRIRLAACILMLSFSVTSSTTFCQTTSSPEKVRFVTEDICRFWQAYDLAQRDTTNMAAIIDSLYLAKGSSGLKKFNELSIRGVDNLVKSLKHHKSFYESIRENTFKVPSIERKMLDAFKRLKSLYPKTKFPDVYFLIGNLSSGGKPTEDALLIGTEIFSADSMTIFDNFDSSFQRVIQSQSITTLPQIVIHELVHYQQSYLNKDKNLLGYAITEGSADFIAELITGIRGNTLAHNYGGHYEKELWTEFKKDIEGYEINKWMYSPAINGRPSDLGYFIGYKVVQSYYTRSKDKSKAIDEILNIEDFSKFLLESEYGNKFYKDKIK